jgi:tetratricopeptide (TPR) repeat protein
MSEVLDATGARAIIAAYPELRDALEILAACEAVSDPLASALLEQFTASNGSTPRVLAAVKAMPFTLQVDSRHWTFQTGPREELLRFLRGREPSPWSRVATFLAESFAAEAATTGGRVAREAHWRAALHAAPVDPEMAFDNFEALVDSAHGANRGVDLDAAAAYAASADQLRRTHPGEVAYLVGRRAYSCRDYRTAERELRLTLAESHRPAMRAIAAHLLAKMVFGQDGDMAEAEDFARESLRLNVARGPEATRFISQVQVTMARILMRRRTRGKPPDEVGALLDQAITIEEGWGGGVFLLLALNTRARYLMRTGETKAAIRDLRTVIRLARANGERRALKDALNTIANALIRDSGSEELAEAERAIDESERLGRQLKERRHLPFVMNTRSRLAEARGDIEQAIKYADEELKLHERMKHTQKAEYTRTRMAKLEQKRTQGGLGV